LSLNQFIKSDFGFVRQVSVL